MGRPDRGGLEARVGASRALNAWETSIPRSALDTVLDALHGTSNMRTPRFVTMSLPLVLLLLQACLPELPEDKPENMAPSTPVIGIGPATPGTNDDLVVAFGTPSSDPEDAVVTYTYSWKQAGVPRPDLTTDTVPASETTRGEAWEVTVLPSDGELTGAPATAWTTIVNTAPEAAVTLSPTEPTTGEALTALVDATDPDDDAVTLAYAWAVDGAPVDASGDTLPGDQTSRGQRWSVTVTPSDAEAQGAPVTAEVGVANSAPVMLSVTIVPDMPFVTDELVAVVEAADADDDPIGYAYTWFVDGAEVQSGTSDTLAAGNVAKHQRVTVEVTPRDSFDVGIALSSADAVVLNSVPVARGARIDAAVVTEASILSCETTGFEDADSDPEAWTYAWTVNGTEVATTATLDGTSFGKGDTVACVATPFDGETLGAAVTSPALTVTNTAPVLASATLSSASPAEADTLSVALGAATDLDGDTVELAYAWYVNGTLVSTSSTLTGVSFDKGDAIYVVVTPRDGTEAGAPVTSATATARNTPPVVTSVTLSPGTVYTNDTLTATVTATDADGDTLGATYAWYVDGVLAARSSTPTLAGVTSFDRDESVYVVVTPNDGEVDGATATSTTVTVQDTAPTAPVVAIRPTEPAPGDDLTCTVVMASVDADGDLVTYTFAWDVDGVAHTGAADTATGSVVTGADVGEGETWTCDVSATDGTAPPTRATTSVTTDRGMPTLGTPLAVTTAGCLPTWGDVNGDGRLDFACSDPSDRLVIYTRGGSATAPTFSLAMATPFLGCCGDDMDYVNLAPLRTGDNESLLNAVGAGDYGGYDGNVFVYPNLGTTVSATPTWTQRGTAGLSSWAQYATTADLDGDGTLELVTTSTIPYPGFSTDGLRVFDINAAGVPSSTVAWSTRRTTLVPDFADLDGDGDVEVFACGYDRGHSYYEKENHLSWTAQIFRRTTGLSFTLDWTSPTTSSDEPDVACRFADVDGDGDQDVVLLSESSTAQGLRGFRNDGGVIATTPTWRTTHVGRKLDVADWDDDGRDDILVSDDESPTINSYIVDLENEVELDSLTGCGWARWVDWTEDGTPDISCAAPPYGGFFLVASE